MSLIIRPALPDDIPAMEALIAASARALSREEYSEAETEAAIAYVFGVDSELVADKSYFVCLWEGQLAACGGWSRRRTLFGGDRYEGRASGLLNPEIEPAKIRAFFVHPNFARRGIGKALLLHCETEARAQGFTQMEMMATLPGVKLYQALGYQGETIEFHSMPNGVSVRFMRMTKSLPNILS